MPSLVYYILSGDATMLRHSILATLVAVFAAWSIQKFHSKRDISQLSRKLNNNNNINRNSSIVFILKLVSYMLCLAVCTRCTVQYCYCRCTHTHTSTRIFVLDLSYLKLTVLYMAYWHPLEWTVNKLKSATLQWDWERRWGRMTLEFLQVFELKQWTTAEIF